MIGASEINVTLLSAMQAFKAGNLTNRTVLGKVKGMGSAFDLVANLEKDQAYGLR